MFLLFAVEYAIVDFSDVTEHRQRYRREIIEEDVECELKEDCLLPITYKGHQKTLNLTRDEILSPDLIPILKKNGDNLLVVASKTKTDTVSIVLRLFLSKQSISNIITKTNMTQCGFLDVTENDNTHAFMEDK